ncbi:tyrosine-type recombinase/integrase [Avibacterium sp. 21-599]|uniref:tyrosine-type recombinase/integrase n=1 Tax=Avibacterium sp. 21-599 TaxID=2911528 RepID=UPI0022466A90|nr:site-specific integrase [Avibacterium sp. 21-599]MCW9718512.1 site-specific integrase [Avibacterium sp. 21-599]
MDGYKKIVNVLTKTYPELMPNDFTHEHVIQWREHVLKSAKPVTWNNYARHLRSLYNFAIEYQFISLDKNPFTKLFITEDKAKRKTLSVDQINVVHDLLCSKENLPDILTPRWFILALFQTFRYTGIRRSQLIKLRICDIDLERKVISIPSHINKNHHYHEIPISKKLYPYLCKLKFEMLRLKQTEKDQLFNINKVSKVVVNRRGEMSVNQVSHIFSVISKLVGFYVSAHRFRHTIATQLMKNVDNVYSVKQLLGHCDIKVTLSYIEYDSEMIRECVDGL